MSFTGEPLRGALYRLDGAQLAEDGGGSITKMVDEVNIRHLCLSGCQILARVGDNFQRDLLEH